MMTERMVHMQMAALNAFVNHYWGWFWDDDSENIIHSPILNIHPLFFIASKTGTGYSNFSLQKPPKETKMEQNGSPGKNAPVIKTFKMAVDIDELNDQIKLFVALAMFMDSPVFEGVINLLKEVKKQYEAA